MAELSKSIEADHGQTIGRLDLPSDDELNWNFVKGILAEPIGCLADLDLILTQFSTIDSNPRTSTFFSTFPGSSEAGSFDFDAFFTWGVPVMKSVALEMPILFSSTQLPIYKMRSSWQGTAALGRRSVSLSRRQCACLLAHSFFGSLKRPAGVQPNDFRFTVSDLFLGSAASPRSATTFLNYFTMLGKHGIPEELVTFERLGYRKGPSPWQWEHNDKPLCRVDLVDGNIDDSQADYHVEFANCFVGGGVMTGDTAMEETLFLVKPELMVAMALQNRMVDEEAICVSGAKKYSLVRGFGSSFEFAGDCENQPHPPKVVAVDAVRGGGPAMTKTALLRDMNKARIALEGAGEVATGHWGCGAFGNNHDLMFLKQWLAASEAGAKAMYYHDFDRNQSHHIFPLIRRLRHLTVGELWGFLLNLTQDIIPCKMAIFSKRIADLSVGKLEVPSEHEHEGDCHAKAPPLKHGASEKKVPSPPSLQRVGPEKVNSETPRGHPVCPESAAVFSVATLKAGAPMGVDAASKENHLSAEDFEAEFGMPREKFLALPQWKRDAAKKKVGLF